MRDPATSPGRQGRSDAYQVEVSFGLTLPDLMTFFALIERVSYFSGGTYLLTVLGKSEQGIMRAAS